MRIVLFLLCLFLHYSALANSNNCIEFANKIIKSDSFITHRGYSTYQGVFNRLKLGTPFDDDLKQLTPDSHILDSGAGFGYFAREFLFPNMISEFFSWKSIKKFLRRQEEDISGKPNFTVVSYKMERNYLTKKLHSEEASEKVNILENQLFEQIPDNKITDRFGKIDLLTDLFGVMSYTHDLSGTFQRYLDLLKTDGKMYLHLGSEHLIQIQTASGKRITFLDWLKTIDGIKIDYIPNSKVMTYRIVKTQEKIEVPKLKILDVKAIDKPPTRVFSLDI